MSEREQSIGRQLGRAVAILMGFAFAFLILVMKKVNDLLGGPKPR